MGMPLGLNACVSRMYQGRFQVALYQWGFESLDATWMFDDGRSTRSEALYDPGANRFRLAFERQWGERAKIKYLAGRQVCSFSHQDRIGCSDLLQAGGDVNGIPGDEENAPAGLCARSGGLARVYGHTHLQAPERRGLRLASLAGTRQRPLHIPRRADSAVR